MEHLVDGLLLLARSDLAALSPRPRLLDLDDLVGAVVRSTAPAGPGTPTVVWDRVRPVQVRSDPQLLRQVLDNVLGNAVRHARSRVELVLEPVDDGAAGPPRRVVLHVDDDGPGIPPEARELVFDRFTRLDPARARTDGGAGLGLAIVRDIVTALQGRVVVDTAPLGGARVTIELPGTWDPGAAPDR